MTALHWLNSEAFTVFGQHIIWSDMIGNTVGLIALTLGWLRSIWTWPAQLLSGVVLVAANASVHQAGSVGKQLVVIAVAVWGWQQWTRGRSRPRTAPSPYGSPPGASAATCSAAPPSAPSPSAACSPRSPRSPGAPGRTRTYSAGTLVAMLAQARGMVEFWFAWLLVDLVGVPLNFHSGLAFSGLIYVVYGALVLWGMRDWWLRSRTPALEGATA